MKKLELDYENRRLTIEPPDNDEEIRISIIDLDEMSDDNGNIIYDNEEIMYICTEQARVLRDFLSKNLKE